MNNNVNNFIKDENKVSASELYKLFFLMISEADDEQLQNMQNALQEEVDRRNGKTTPSRFGMANNPYWNCED